MQSCLDQTFVDFGVAVVDDRWIDGTAETMRANPDPWLASLRLAGLAQEDVAGAVPLSDSATAHAAAMLEVIRNPPSRPDVVTPSWDVRVESLLELYRSVSGHRASQYLDGRRAAPRLPPRDP